MGLPKKRKVAFVVPSNGVYSETFIRVQQEMLPFVLVNYYGGFFPKNIEGKKAIVNNSFLPKSFNRIRRMLSNYSLNFNEYLLSKSFVRNKIDVVLAQFGPTGESIAKACATAEIPLIVHFHGADASVDELIKKYNHYKSVFSSAWKVICVSKVMEEKLISLGCPSEKLIYNTYGPRDHFLDIAPTFENPHFFAMGRFTDKKAPYYTILAFKEVLKKHPKAKLTMGGDGQLLSTCKNLVHYYKMDHAVDFPGVLNTDQVLDYFRNSSAFVQHSIVADDGDAEGTPLSILEASAASLPVISTYHAGIQDVIINESSGLLVKEHDVKTMAEAMINLLGDLHKAKEMGQNGRKNIIDHFSLKRHIDVLSSVIQSAIEK
jgi:colanic acid/amylovoran biosynthesis glycosyltransferase